MFLRREWKSIALFGGGFSLLMAAAVLWLDPAFFYPRLSTDPLLYYLKAKSFLETGSTAARVAVNVPPFAYAAMPGVLRAPLIYAFTDFDNQWRAIQLTNIPIIASVALMSAYIFSWTLPRRWHWLAIAFAFAFTAISPVWIANVFSLLADAPYAACSLLALIISTQVLCDERPVSDRRWLIAVYVILVGVTFLLRFTGPVLLVFAAGLAKGRWTQRSLSQKKRRRLIGGPIAGVIVLVALNAQAIFGRYIRDSLSFAVSGDKQGMLLNLFGLAIPDQILPDFHLGFSAPPIIDQFYGEFAHTRGDAVWTALGLVVSAIVVYGMWRSRDRFLPEILYVLAPLTVLTLMMPSTPRYLMSYQPFFWIFFYQGARALFRRYVTSAEPTRSTRLVGVAVASAVVIVVAGLRWNRVAGTGTDRGASVSASYAEAYFRGISTTFRSVREFLETLPRDRTLLIGSRSDTGRWSAIAGRSYYLPDSSLHSLASIKEVYLIVECGTLEYCQAFPEWKNRMQDELCTYGEFTYEQVFAVRSKWARAEVFRIRPAA
ncbi:MAG: hypothetical protein ABJC63_00545 [Gemmatimonadales bacterium]